MYACHLMGENFTESGQSLLLALGWDEIVSFRFKVSSENAWEETVSLIFARWSHFFYDSKC